LFYKSFTNMTDSPMKNLLRNRDFILLLSPLSLLPVALIAVASTFLLGYLVELAGKVLKIDPKITITLVLLGTLKNYGPP